MGRGRIEIKRIDNPTNRQVTFSKRRQGLLKKARELSILCDAQVGVVIFSQTGKVFEYCSPDSSIGQVISRYQRATNTQSSDIDHRNQILSEISRMRTENDKLQASMRQYTGEDLAGLPLNDLNQLEEQLEHSVNRVRARKHQLMHQQLENLRRKEQLLEDQNNHLCRALAEQQAAAAAMEHHQAAEEQKVAHQDMPLDPYGHFYPDEQTRNILQLSPHLPGFRLQPTQPNLQEAGFHGHGLQLWYVTPQYMHA